MSFYIPVSMRIEYTLDSRSAFYSYAETYDPYSFSDSGDPTGASLNEAAQDLMFTGSVEGQAFEFILVEQLRHMLGTLNTSLSETYATYSHSYSNTWDMWYANGAITEWFVGYGPGTNAYDTLFGTAEWYRNDYGNVSSGSDETSLVYQSWTWWTDSFEVDYDLYDEVVNFNALSGLQSLAILYGDHPLASGGEDADVVVLSDTGRIQVSYQGNTRIYDLDSIFDAAGGNDSITGGLREDHISGGEGHDTLSGAAASDSLYGGGGADLLYGGLGDDELQGEGGNDSAYGGEGQDYLLGGDGDDLLDGGAGDDTLDGQGSGNDTLFGGDGNDNLSGHDGGSIYGGAGNDTIYGTLYGGELVADGGAGSDYFDVSATSAGVVTLSGGDGDDTLLVWADVSGEVDLGDGADTLNVDAQNAIRVTTGAGKDRIVLQNWSEAVGNKLEITDFQAGTDGDVLVLDRLFGAGRDPFAEGMLSLRQAGGDAVLWLDSDGDGAAEAVRLVTFRDTDAAAFAPGNISPLSASLDDAPVVTRPLANRRFAEDSGRFSFTLPSDSFTDPEGKMPVLSARLANGRALPAWLSFDTATGSFTGTPPANFNGALDIRVTASDGRWKVSDEFRLAILPVNDAPTGRILIDKSVHVGTAVRADVSALADADGLGAFAFQWLRDGKAIRGATEAAYIPSVADIGARLSVRVRYEDGDGTRETITSAATARVPLEPLVGTSAKDTLTGSHRNDTIRGGGGNDTLDGRAGNDKLFGDSGGDELKGGTGADTLDGGSGNDRLFGGSGQDLLRGGAGADTLDGGGGADRMAGGSGNDTYIVNATGDLISEARRGGVDHVRTSVDLTLAANVENLTMTGKADLTAVGNGSANLMTGNSGRNTLNGARGNDTLDGGGGNDRLTGGQGNDLLKGSTGADTLDGGSGRDVLTGGGGADVFVFAAGSGRDVITDFRKSADMIQLRDLGVSSFSEVRALATRVDGDVVIRFGEGDTLILRDTTIQALSEAMIFV